MLFLCFHSSVQISNRKALIGSCCPARVTPPQIIYASPCLSEAKQQFSVSVENLGEYRQLCCQSDSRGNLAALVPLQLILDAVSEEEHREHVSVCEEGVQDPFDTPILL